MKSILTTFLIASSILCSILKHSKNISQNIFEGLKDMLAKFFLILHVGLLIVGKSNSRKTVSIVRKSNS